MESKIKTSVGRKYLRKTITFLAPEVAALLKEGYAPINSVRWFDYNKVSSSNPIWDRPVALWIDEKGRGKLVLAKVPNGIDLVTSGLNDPKEDK